MSINMEVKPTQMIIYFWQMVYNAYVCGGEYLCELN